MDCPPVLMIFPRTFALSSAPTGQSDTSKSFHAVVTRTGPVYSTPSTVAVAPFSTQVDASTS